MSALKKLFSGSSSVAEAAEKALAVRVIANVPFKWGGRSYATGQKLIVTERELQHLFALGLVSFT
jgi:hypothetical protein